MATVRARWTWVAISLCVGCHAPGGAVIDGSVDDDTDRVTSEDPVDTDEDLASGFPEVDDFAAEGPYTVLERAGGPDCTVFYPEELGVGGLGHPVILWGNGTYTTPVIYGGVLVHWASHGFIVAAANTSWAGTGAEMLACLDLLTQENDRAESDFFGHVDLSRVGASGHSQGGGGSIMAGTDARVSVTAPLQPYTEQGFGGYEQESQGQQRGPMFMMSGSEDDIAPATPNQQRVWDTVNVDIVWGMLAGADHIFAATGDIGGYRGPATAWLRYHLMDDVEAGSLFYDPCELCEDVAWDVQRQIE